MKDETFIIKIANKWVKRINIANSLVALFISLIIGNLIYFASGRYLNFASIMFWILGFFMFIYTVFKPTGKTRLIKCMVVKKEYEHSYYHSGPDSFSYYVNVMTENNSDQKKLPIYEIYYNVVKENEKYNFVINDKGIIISTDLDIQNEKNLLHTSFKSMLIKIYILGAVFLGTTVLMF